MRSLPNRVNGVYFLTMRLADTCLPSQHYAKHPHEIFTNPYASLDVDLANTFVLESHLQCAAQELPVHPYVHARSHMASMTDNRSCREEDVPYFGPDLLQLCKERLVPDEEGFFHAHYRFRPYPAKHVSIRSTDDDTYHVVDVTDGRNRILEEVEWARAIFELYEGAIFMHQGQSFLVKELSHDRKMARLERTNVEWTTRQRDFTCAALCRS